VTLSLIAGAFGGGVRVAFGPAAWCSQQKSDSNGDVDAVLTSIHFQYVYVVLCIDERAYLQIYTYTLSKSDHMFDFEYLAWNKNK